VEEVPISVSVSGKRLAEECQYERREAYVFAISVLFFVAVGPAAHSRWHA
jgi:hypothetical protein